MLRTLDRYVVREVLPPFLLALLIFTFLLELPPLMREMETLIAKGVSWQTAGTMIGLLLPQALGLTIPMALLVGYLIGLGRLSSDREAVALLACGVSPYRLLRPVLALASLATLVTTWVMVVAIPDANQKFREIEFDIISKKVETDVRPRVFFQEFPNWVLYPRDEAPPGQAGWKDVLVADTRRPGATELYLAQRGRLVLNYAQRRVDMVLSQGTRYSIVRPGESDIFHFPGDQVVQLNPEAVFPQLELPRGVTEQTIDQLRATIRDKVRNGISTHNEIMAIHAKFSIPVACLVFAVTALALGLTVARDGKLAGFVVGIAVIFAYYIVMFLAEGMAKGQVMSAHLARWAPNIVLGLFGIAALIWRVRYAEGRLPFPRPAWRLAPPWRTRRPGLASAPRPTARSTPGSRVVVVVRVPRVRLPMPGLIDRYISRLYLRVVGLSFLALLGLFYISTFIDKSEKVFKGQATTGMVMSLLAYSTPMFVYYIIPIAALLSVLVTFGLLARSSELTVMKACGVSLYRAAVSVIVLSLGFSVVLFGLDQQVLAAANRRAELVDAKIRGRPPRVYSALNRRWVVGRDGSIYHYAFFDAQQAELADLTIYQPRADEWALARQLTVSRAAYREGAWYGERGSVQDFTTTPPTWSTFTHTALPSLETPDYFATEQPVADMMSVGQLRQYIADLSASGFNVIPASVDLQKKLAFPFVTVVMTLLAVPFGVSAGRRGALYGIGLGIVLALSYWVVISAFVAIGKGGLLPPMLAAWAPNILVVGIATYLLLRART